MRRHNFIVILLVFDSLATVSTLPLLLWTAHLPLILKDFPTKVRTGWMQAGQTGAAESCKDMEGQEKISNAGEEQ